MTILPENHMAMIGLIATNRRCKEYKISADREIGGVLVSVILEVHDYDLSRDVEKEVYSTAPTLEEAVESVFRQCLEIEG